MAAEMFKYDIVELFPDKAWLEETLKKVDKKLHFSIQKAREVDYIPYTTENGQWKPNKIGWWTNGFWPAMMWQMYLATKDEIYREEAIRTEKMLDEALKDFKTTNHDMGFMWLIQSGVHYALEGNQDSYDRTLLAATLLAGRFNPNGFIRAWNGKEQQGWAIVDCMMNLPLLYWASDVTNDPRYRNIAIAHADSTMKNFVRADGSCNHIVIYDPMTGEVLDNPAGQGCHSGSSWSRGQAWALYGFTLSYMATGKQEYLDTAKKVAHYFISNVLDDYIPRCDFRQPEEPDVKDNAGGGAAICGLLELCRLLPQKEAAVYYDAAVKMLMAMTEKCVNWEEDDPGLCTMCTEAYLKPQTYHITMNYADYYFVEALTKLRGQSKLFWRPHK